MIDTLVARGDIINMINSLVARGYNMFDILVARGLYYDRHSGG